jgi:ketosteroid isomerase-like protein
MKILILAAACFAMLIACNQHQTTPTPITPGFSLDSAKAAIDANNRAFTESIEKGDSLLFISGYATDGCVIPDGGMPKMCGKDGLAKFYAYVRSMSVASIKLTTTEVTGGEELVSEEGNYDVIAKDGSSIDKGRFLVTWKKESGTWKKYRDIWNSEIPAPAPSTK